MEQYYYHRYHDDRPLVTYDLIRKNCTKLGANHRRLHQIGNVSEKKLKHIENVNADRPISSYQTDILRVTNAYS